MRCILALAMLTIAAVSMATAQQRDTAYARVTYVSGTSVYLDAGERDGLAEGTELDLVRAGAVVARLRVRFLSPARAQCEVVSGASEPAIGDSVRYSRSPRTVAADTAAIGPPGAAAPAATSMSRGRRELPLHGRVGVRYLATFQRDGGAGGITQPASDLRVTGTLPGVPTLEMTLDARGRRTRSVAFDGVTSRLRTATLVYQASLGWRSPAGARVTIGRQYAPELASVSLFDGALVGYDGPRIGAGAFVGSQPDWEDMRLSTRVREYGAYLSARSPADAPASWTLSTGAVGSYDAGQLDREFGFVSGTVSHALVSLYALQELDYNRGWKRTFDPAITPTSTYLSLRVRASDALTLQTGYDTRRSARLYRNYVTPEIAFDDTFRTGVWGGVHARLGAVGTASLDARHSSGGTAGGADIYSFSGTARRHWTVPLEFRARSSWYDTPVTSGWLHSTAVAVDARHWLRLEASGGARLETPAPGTSAATTTDRLTVGWLELNADIAVGRSWYVLFSAARERGGLDSGDQFYTALTYRF